VTFSLVVDPNSGFARVLVVEDAVVSIEHVVFPASTSFGFICMDATE
jgi:hypothetical protein